MLTKLVKEKKSIQLNYQPTYTIELALSYLIEN